MNKENKQLPLVEFKNITVLKNITRVVLDCVSLTINQGENVAILGPNGAGKSSLIKTITRQHYPSYKDEEYSAKVWGQEDWNIFDLRSTLGIVSNDLQHECDTDVSGFETVLSGFFSSIGIYKEPVTPEMEKKVEEVLDFLEIEHLKDKNMDQMSSGEARRFLIGRALVHDPKALILDEPMNNLDPHALFKFSDILRKLAKAGTSVILVTQNIHDIIPEITRVVFMKAGRIVSDGRKEDIITGTKMSELFNTPMKMEVKDGYYYVFRP
jgi:iron complex transport system ATP-binding protein